MRSRVVSDFRLAGIVCHVVCLIILVADRIPSASSATAESAADISTVVAADSDAAAVSSSSAAVPKTRSVRAAVLPLGHRYIGLGKRLLLTSHAGGGDHDKRPYSLQDGAAMRFIGLGKRGAPRVVDSGLRFIGLGKRNSAAMRYIGLGKRPLYDGDAEERNQDMEDEEEDEAAAEEDGEDGEDEDRHSRAIEKRSADGGRYDVMAHAHYHPMRTMNKN